MSSNDMEIEKVITMEPHVNMKADRFSVIVISP